MGAIVEALELQLLPKIQKQVDFLEQGRVPLSQQELQDQWPTGEMAKGIKVVAKDEKGVQVTIKHSNIGEVTYTIDSHFLDRARGKKNALDQAVLDLLHFSSTCPKLSKVLAWHPQASVPTCGIAAVLAARQYLDSLIVADKRPTPWVVICLSLNLQGSAHSIDGDVLLQDVRDANIANA